MSKNLEVTQIQAAAVTNSDTNCTSVDMKGYESLMFVVNVGASADTINGSNYIELEVEDSSDDSTFSDCADADILDSVSATNNGTFGLIDAASEDEATFKVGYVGDKRYVRVVLSFTGTHSTGTPISVDAIRGNAAVKPV